MIGDLSKICRPSLDSAGDTLSYCIYLEVKVHFKPSAEVLIISIQARFQLVSLFYYSAPHLPFGVYQYCFCVISCVKPMISSQSFGGGPYRSPCGMLPKSRITSAGCLTGAMMENQVNNGRYGYILKVYD